MALADLPDGFVTFTRDQLIDKYKRDYLLRNPGADVLSGQPDLDARQAADLVLPIYADAVTIANGINEDAATGDRLDLVGNRIGIPRAAAAGASGYVACTTAAGGATLQLGDELENPQTRKKYQAGQTKRVNDGDHILIQAKSTGPDTNVDPGAVLRWTSPRPGLGQNATVVDQGGGVGLTGGSDAQNDARYLDAIRTRKQNPVGGDNDAEIAAIILSTPDLPVEQVFTYPGFMGPGSSGFTFTVLAESPSASRIPTTAQVQAAFEWLRSQLPGDGSYFPLVPNPMTFLIAFAVTWATGGWTDATPWPAAFANGVDVFGVSGPLSFTLLGGTVAPVPGNTIAFWDNANGVFRRKTISAVSGVGPWSVTCTSDLGASDTTYTPFVGQRVSPWSDNLAKVAEPVLGYLQTLGPGECFALTGSFIDGRRMKRFPYAPKSWPYTTGTRVTVDLASIPEIADANAVAGTGVTVPPAVPPNMLQLADLCLFPS